MKITVAICTYNGAKVVRTTLDSVLRQTLAPAEILVLNDGSTDDTLEILRSYEPRITVMSQENSGIAASRNRLAKTASGDLVAFLDHDDEWHPQYLEFLAKHFAAHPEACAFYTGHIDFQSEGKYDWGANPPAAKAAEMIPPREFLIRYHEKTGDFGSMSFLAVPKEVLKKLMPEPFKFSTVEDTYLAVSITFLGPVLFDPTPRAAYRITPQSISANRLKSFGLWVQACESLAPRFKREADRPMRRAFNAALANTRRRYGKLLMGSGQASNARAQFLAAAREPGTAGSMAKSLALWGLTRAPKAFQPGWPVADRQAGDRMMNYNLGRRGAPSAQALGK